MKIRVDWGLAEESVEILISLSTSSWWSWAVGSCPTLVKVRGRFLMTCSISDMWCDPLAQLLFCCGSVLDFVSRMLIIEVASTAFNGQVSQFFSCEEFSGSIARGLLSILAEVVLG
ncbi:hypothetical protein F2Q70_00029298 [Brassica cretica]|uniref:Uncharacterized protein n=2 Tax=Brassica cretica TaxID=69181 RepID=A0A8S9FMI3_BRACR|nr:hypothetical protein F2Q70_00029298 [Brassica cretica]